MPTPRWVVLVAATVLATIACSGAAAERPNRAIPAAPASEAAPPVVVLDPGRSSYGGGTPGRDAPDGDEDVGDIAELANADDVASSGIERLTRAFPGSKVITSDD